MRRFDLESQSGEVVAPQVQDKYQVYSFPTVILFVNGKENARWDAPHAQREAMERALDSALGSTPAKPG